MTAVMEAQIDISNSTSDVFKIGSVPVTNTITKTDGSYEVEMLILAPTKKGTYPVLLFCHGWLLRNTYYTDLITHIATHGYIVVAPQFYTLPVACSVSEEVQKAVEVATWISSGLSDVLPENVSVDTKNVALSGHSRGGKIAFALALGKYQEKSKSRRRKVSAVTDDTTLPTFKAIIGIDPVGGTSPSDQQKPKILEYIPRCFQQSIPVAVIGTGLGNQWLGLCPPFAPDGVNHSEFFNESKPPVSYFLAKEYGHCDMLDDWILFLTGLVCKSGSGDKDLLRKGIGGIVVAFLKANLGSDEVDFNAIIKDPSIAPVTLDPVIYVKE